MIRNTFKEQVLIQTLQDPSLQLYPKLRKKKCIKYKEHLTIIIHRRFLSSTMPSISLAISLALLVLLCSVFSTYFHRCFSSACGAVNLPILAKRIEYHVPFASRHLLFNVMTTDSYKHVLFNVKTTALQGVSKTRGRGRGRGPLFFCFVFCCLALTKT